ncbi:protein ALTERED PHOSPHATE STARVATION RESPONSE 1-like isoform X1 [Phoenix dactylifera]|uniref:Protein ALTERED PHOSPHATE STARVATION RESPONSE 1-like isoform X1 n=1 Tax=Phoenix dactylifera TaxID=42345 RepID=A0A8B8J197_PHODC|nr:protein ALTERED PHOSPHATE STARVATION RESPONSE 1-like isoform X1 [Phoenix dactylifera]
MGCAGSKLEDQEAVALCRERTLLLADAIRHRYALADAHAAYSLSLRSVGAALHTFLHGGHSVPLGSPILPLPAHRKGDPLPPMPPSPPPAAIPASASAGAGGHHSRSHSGSSHIHFQSSDEDSDEDEEFHLHSNGSSPVDLHPDGAPGPTFVNVNYARNHPTTPSISFEQRPRSPEAVHFGSSEPPPSAYPYYGYTYPPQNPSFYPYPYPYPSYGGVGGFFGSSSPPPNIPQPPTVASMASPSSSKTPPPPPSPPRTSTWDFLNPFESYDDGYYAPYTPSRSSKEVREEEGIPDLEDEEHEVVKEAYGDQKSMASTSAAAAAPGDYSAKAAAVAAKEDSISDVEEGLHRTSKSGEGTSDGGSEHEVHVVEKNVVADEVQRQEEQRNVAAVPPPRRYHDVSEVVQEIKTQFDRASESANEVSKMLEVGKLPYHQKNSVYKAVSAVMVCGLPPSTSKNEGLLEYEEDKAMACGNLSSTLQKLYMWEQKLLDEVKAEEKMRVLYDRKCEQLKRLSERGEEAHKLEAAQTLIRKLSTKIKIAIQIVDSISNKISKLRDDELWPQISELIQGLMRMWRFMFECHHIQCQAVSEAQNLDSIVAGGKLSDAHMEATKQLELELLEWISNFFAWVCAQRSFVKALNGWLVKGLRYVPEETDDGVPPFSPGRLGAPPVFVICNYWTQTMDRISEAEVVNAMKAFSTNVLHLWEQHKLEQRQRLMANRDMDRTVRILERDEQQMRKALEAQNKKLVLISNHSGIALSEGVHQDLAAEVGSLQSSLREIFEAMENFAASTMKAYEELNLRTEEEKQRLARENVKVS